MKLQRLARGWLFVAVVIASGCAPEAPSVRYSGSTLAATQAGKVQIFRSTMPERPYQELGGVHVSCPTEAQGGGFGVHLVGGCNYEVALGMATVRAARAGADALVHIESAAAGNGRVVSLQAVAVHFTGAATPPPAPAAAPATSGPSVEQRLRKLKALADQGLITADEYAKRKAQLIEEL